MSFILQKILARVFLIGIGIYQSFIIIISE